MRPIATRTGLAVVLFAVFILFLISTSCVAFSYSSKAWKRPTRDENTDSQWAKKTVITLSLEQKIGQMIQVRYYGDYKSFESADYRFLREQIHRYHIGSVVLGMHFNGSGPVRISAVDAARIANQLQTDSELPLLFAADLERGIASRLKDVPAYPWPMAWGAVGDPRMTERFGEITGKEARAVGIQWILAPVADVNDNPANPVINDRSFGEDSALVSDLVAAYIRGAHTTRALATAKHFPGHGDSSVDSHRGIPSIDGDRDHLNKIEFPPFKSAAQVGVDSIMLAHARVPSIDSDPNHIATTSFKVVTEVLKGQLGFKGVVLTDALEMKGITSLYDSKQGSPTALAAVDAVKAGCDVIMVPTDLDGAYNAILNAVRIGEIPESRIDESVRKILGMKAAAGLDKNRYVDVEHATERVNNPEDRAFAQQVADQAVTLVRSNGKVLPLKSATAQKSGLETDDPPQRHALIVVLLAETMEATSGHDFEREIMSRRPDAHVFYVDNRTANAGGIQVLEAVKQTDEVVVAAYVVHGGAREAAVDGKTVTSYGMRGPTGELLRKILATRSEKTVVIALGSPYLIANFLEIQNYVCTYAMASTSEVSAVKALFGEIQNTAKLPVTIPGVAPRGFSLPWPTTKKTDASASH